MGQAKSWLFLINDGNACLRPTGHELFWTFIIDEVKTLIHGTICSDFVTIRMWKGRGKNPHMHKICLSKEMIGVNCIFNMFLLKNYEAK